MRLLAVLLVVSLIIHLGLFAVPLPEKKLEKKEVIPVSIVDYKTLEQKKEQPKKQQKPKPKTVTKKPEPKKDVKKEQQKEVKKETASVETKKAEADKQQVENKKAEEKPFRPKGADDPLVLPDIKVPLTPNETVPEIAVPDVPKPNIDVPVERAEGQKNIDISKELSSLSEAQKNMQAASDSISHDVQKETAKAEDAVKGNIYKFDIAPTGNRKVVYLPPDPVFALANDTKVTVRFNIDKAGNTYNITFISRSSYDVEKLASDYISRMKFDAIIENRDDFAQITIQFKVQK